MHRPSPSLVVAACTLLLLLASGSADAWSARGHRMVARLAEPDLTPAARAEIAHLLEGESKPTLAGIAPWADQLRAEDPGLGRRSAPWHYVNIGENACTYREARDCPDGNCIVGAIRDQMAVLSDRSQSDDARRQALKFVVHFVGDAHQPMHSGYARDRGGNDFQLNWNGRGTNLHAMWDRTLLETKGLDETAHVAALRAGPSLPGPRATAADAARWVEQGCRIALSPGVYPPRARIDDRYLDTQRPVAERQLRLAGKRLADLLNSALSNG